LTGFPLKLVLGRLLAFVGPNGAGKTYNNADANWLSRTNKGSANISGYDVWKNTMEVKKLIGYLPENNPLYPDMYVYDF